MTSLMVHHHFLYYFNFFLSCRRWQRIKKFIIDTPPNSLKDSNVSLKMKTTETIVEVTFLVRNISKVKKVC